jgi:hypothetical protein
VSILGSFGYATYVNIRQVTKRQRGNRGKVEEQITRSLILQCISFVLSQVSSLILIENDIISIRRYHI